MSELYTLTNDGEEVKMTREEAEALIPKDTVYCMHGRVDCPFWSKIAQLPDGENGYCAFLGKSDFELNEEKGEIVWKDSEGNVLSRTKAHEIPHSTLFAKYKMCGINR